MKSRRSLFAILVILLVVAAWQLSTKRDMLKVDRLKEGWAELVGSPESEVASQTTPVQPVEPEEEGPPVTDPVPPVQSGSPGEMYPFSADAPLLETTVPLTNQRIPLVYVAFGCDSNQQYTSASLCFSEFFKFQLQQQGSGQQLVNALENSRLVNYYHRAFRDSLTPLTYDQFQREAEEVKADFFFYPTFDGSTTEPRATVKLVDISTSRSETWSSVDTGLTSVNQMITSAAQAALAFAGCTNEQLQHANLQQGAPADATFAWYVSTPAEAKTYEALLEISKADPDCRYVFTHDGGTTWSGQLLDIGVRRFPDDPRLLTRKVLTLHDVGSTASMLRYSSELIRRYPDNIFTYQNLAERLDKVYPCGGNAKETPPVYRAMIDQLGLLSEKYPESYCFAWSYAYGLKNLGSYKRGSHTVDKIPDHIWPERQLYIERGYEIMEQLVEKHLDFPNLLAAYMFYIGDVRAMTIHEQRRFMEKIRELDPRETAAELAVASNHSIGYGRPRDYFTIIDRAFKNHAGDPQATRKVADALRVELSRQIGWEAMTEQEAYTGNNPYTNRLMDAAAFVYSSGMNLGFDSDWVYYLMMERRGNVEKIKEWHQNGQNSFAAAKEADAAFGAEDWEKCLKFSRLALPHMPLGDKGHHIRYFMAKSLWQLKQYEECFRVSRVGMTKYPDEQSFYYTYAAAALDSEQNLEAGYDCAWRFMDLMVGRGKDYDELVRVFEGIRKKLNKPQHPKLIAEAN